MTLSKNIIDREFAKFKDCNNETAVRVCYPDNYNIPIQNYPSGSVVKNNYSQVNAVASGSAIDIISYTVPAGKSFKIIKVFAEGTNKARYKILIDNIDTEIKRSWWTKFNVTFDLTELILTAGQVIKIEVLHSSSTTGDFSGNILGAEF